MKVDVPGRGAVDIRRVMVLGPVWTDPDMYRETCHRLQGTADAAAGDAVPIEFSWQPWRVGDGDGHMLRQMLNALVAEYNDVQPHIDGVCLLPGWNTDGPATFAAAVANTLGAAVMGLDEWLRALEPADGKQKGGE